MAGVASCFILGENREGEQRICRFDGFFEKMNYVFVAMNDLVEKVNINALKDLVEKVNNVSIATKDLVEQNHVFVAEG